MANQLLVEWHGWWQRPLRQASKIWQICLGVNTGFWVLIFVHTQRCKRPWPAARYEVWCRFWSFYINLACNSWICRTLLWNIVSSSINWYAPSSYLNLNLLTKSPECGSFQMKTEYLTMPISRIPCSPLVLFLPCWLFWPRKHLHSMDDVPAAGPSNMTM